MGCFCKFPKSKVNHSPFSLYNIFLTICNCFKSICTKNGASFIFSFIMKILGPSLVIFLTLMVVSIYSLFVLFVLPKIFKHFSLMVIFTYILKVTHIILMLLKTYILLQYILNFLFITFSSLSTLFNYYCCVFTRPGSPPVLTQRISNVLGQTVEIIDGKKVIYSNQIKHIKPGVR